MKKVKANRPCKISKNDRKTGIKFAYKFKANEIKEVKDEHLDSLLNTGIIKLCKGGK